MTLTEMKRKIQAGEGKVCENEAQYKGSFCKLGATKGEI